MVALVLPLLLLLFVSVTSQVHLLLHLLLLLGQGRKPSPHIEHTQHGQAS